MLNELHFCDNREVLKQIPKGSINLFLEDMPYNIVSSDYDNEIVDLEEYWSLRLPKLATNGLFALCASGPFSFKLYNSNPKMFRKKIIWEKNMATGFLHAKREVMTTYEEVLIFSPSSKRTFNPQKILSHPYAKSKMIRYPNAIQKGYTRNVSKMTYKGMLNKSNTMYDRNPTHTNPVDVLYIDQEDVICYVPFEKDRYDSSNKNINRHPAQKPLNLMRWLIRTYSNAGDTIFDGFSGSGTGSIACLEENRNFIACEKHPDYYKLGCERIKLWKVQTKLVYV